MESEGDEIYGEAIMNIEEANEVLSKVSHPFMLFTLEKIFDKPNDSVAKLCIAHKVVDSISRETIVPRRSRVIHIAYIREERDLVDQVWNCVRQAHAHEAGEFFKFKGIAIHHPHSNTL